METTASDERRHEVLLVVLIWTFSDLVFWAPYAMRAGPMTSDKLIGIPIVFLLGLSGALALFPIIRRAHPLKMIVALPLLLPIFAVMGLVISAIDIWIFDTLASLLASVPDGADYQARLISNFSAFFTQYGIIAAVICNFEANRARRDREVELANAKVAAAQAANAANLARLSALRYQLNPHFLFNTLNSISSLVITKRNSEGEAMLERLADFLRMTLGDRSCEGERLEHELETIDAYLAIERVRFGERLAVEICATPETRDAEMPSFLLQPLVENAVKYGMSSNLDCLIVRIEAMREDDDLVVIVEDNGTGSEGPVSSTGIGTKNVQERLTALYGERGKLQTARRESGYIAIVRLPFLAR